MDRAYPFIKSASNGDKRKLGGDPFRGGAPNDYHRYARWCVKCQFPPEIRHELSRDHGPDLDQEVLTLAWEAYSRKLPLKQAGGDPTRVEAGTTSAGGSMPSSAPRADGIGKGRSGQKRT